MNRKPRKVQSTKTARTAALHALEAIMQTVPVLSDAALEQLLSDVKYHKYVRHERVTREMMVCSLAVAFARKIVDA